MNKKHLAGASSILITATLSLIWLQPNTPPRAAVMPPAPATAQESPRTVDTDEQARVDAETARQEVPAILAARAEQERLAAEEAARQEQQRKTAAAAAAAEERRRAAAAAKPPTKPAAPAPTTGTNNNSLADPGTDATRRCIMRKESGGNYSIVSKNGTYHGAYQFSRATGDATAKRMGRPDLVGTPVSQWTPAEQDQAFWTLWNHGAGRGNWPTAHGC